MTFEDDPQKLIDWWEAYFASLHNPKKPVEIKNTYSFDELAERKPNE